MNPDLSFGALAKPERRSRVKRRADRKRMLTRRQCCEIVYRREHMRCQRCKRLTETDCWPWEPQRAHVNELIPRSRGGDPLDVANLELVCNHCHVWTGGAHAPTPERMKRLMALSQKAKRMKREAQKGQA